MSQPDISASVTIGARPPIIADRTFDPNGIQTITVNLPGVLEGGRTITINSKPDFGCDGGDEMADSDLLGRVGRLETNVGTIGADMATVKERLTHMPTNAALWRAVAVSAGAVIVSMLAIVQYLAKPWLQGLIDSIKP